MPRESRAEYYRRKAGEARQTAETLLEGSTLKATYLEAERAWLELAEEAERLDREDEA